MKLSREHWTSQIGFIMAAAGSAIGLGSLWRFPYAAGESGGGAFVLLYTLFTIFLAIPLFIGELIIGRKTQLSPVGAYNQLSSEKRNWKTIGYLNLATSFIILSFYCVISGWCLNYTFLSLNQFYIGKTDAQISQVFDIVAASPNMTLFWFALFILINVGIVYEGVRKGIEYWSRILTPALFLILIGLLIYASTLQGFEQAFHFIFDLRWKECSPNTILKALGMAFFSLSTGLGIIVTYGSYLKPEESLLKTTGVIAMMTLFVSISASLMIFSIAFSYNVPPNEGVGLIFKVMPILFAKLPGALLISTIFFLLFVFTALTSSISLFEVLIASLMEIRNWSRMKATVITSIAIFLFGIPSALATSKKFFPSWEQIYGKNFLDTMNDVTADWMLPLACLLATLFMGYTLDKKLLREEFTKGNKWHGLFLPWMYNIRYLIPLVIILILLTKTQILDFNSIFSYFRSANPS